MGPVRIVKCARFPFLKRPRNRRKIRNATTTTDEKKEESLLVITSEKHDLLEGSRVMCRVTEREKLGQRPS